MTDLPPDPEYVPPDKQYVPPRTSAVADDNARPIKAVVALVVTFLSTLLASTEGREDLDTLGWSGWLTIILGALVSALAVYLIPNPKTETRV